MPSSEVPASAEITRAECRERARLLRVSSYDVVLDLTRGEAVFGSVLVTGPGGVGKTRLSMELCARLQPRG